MLLRPPADLDPWVSAGIGLALEDGQGVDELHFPAMLASSVVVVLEGELWRQAGNCWLALPRAFVSGPSTSPVTLRRSTQLRCVCVMLRPAAAGALLQGPTASLLLNTSEDALDIWGTGCRSWLDQVLSARDLASGFECLFGFIRSLVVAPACHERTRADSRLQQAALHGLAKAAQLVGCSDRHFERLFSASFGIGPKLFQRLARAEAALRDAMAHGRCDAQLALRHSYFDQSHLGRDFRALAGGAPGVLLEGVRTDDPAHWPLRIGANYRRAGVRADFASGMSVFS